MANEMVFENKASKYSEGRPSYAPEVINKILNDILSTNGIVADIGSGTGVLTSEFIKKGYEIYAVEPNSDMRRKAEQKLSIYSNFHSVDASAENTGLNDKSVSLIIVASAFHWFDAIKFKQECMRVLRDNGVVCIIFNVRVYDEFTKKQCKICKKYCDGFESLTHGYDKTINLIDDFYVGNYAVYEYDFPLEYTKQKFISRCLSSSYAPLPDSKNYEAYICEIKALLDETFKEEILNIANKTMMFVGKVK